MPLYNYECKKCGDSFEELHTFTKRNEPTNIPCGKCGGEIFIRICGTSLISGYHIKPKTEFSEKLRSLKKFYPGSTIKDR